MVADTPNKTSQSLLVLAELGFPVRSLCSFRGTAAIFFEAFQLGYVLFDGDKYVIRGTQEITSDGCLKSSTSTVS